jgi:hypothetical protein
MEVSSSSSLNSRICGYGHFHDAANGLAGQHAGNRVGNRVGCGHDGGFAERGKNLEGVSQTGTLLADLSKGDWLRADLLPDPPHSLASATVRLAQTFDAFERGHPMTIEFKEDQIKQLKADMAGLDKGLAPNDEHLQLMHDGLKRDCNDQLGVEQEMYTGPRDDRHLSRAAHLALDEGRHLENESARVLFGRGDRASASQVGDFDWGTSSRSERQRAWVRDMDRAREIELKRLSEREREEELERETERKREEEISRLELELRQSDRDRRLSREHNRKSFIQCGMNLEVINVTNGFDTPGACTSSRVCACVCVHLCARALPLFFMTRARACLCFSFYMRVVSFLPGLTSVRTTGEGVSESDFEEFRVVVTPRKTWEGGVSGRGWERWGVGEMDSIASSLAVTPPSVAPSRQANVRNGTGGEGRGAGPSSPIVGSLPLNGLRSGDVHVKGMEVKKDGEKAVEEEDELHKYLTDSILYSSRGSSRACPDGFDSKPKLHFCDLQLFRETFQNFMRKSLHDSLPVAVHQPESIRNHEDGDFIHRSSSQRVGTDPVQQSMTMAMISSMLCKNVAAFEYKVSSRVRTDRQNKAGEGASQPISEWCTKHANYRTTLTFLLVCVHISCGRWLETTKQN